MVIHKVPSHEKTCINDIKYDFLFSHTSCISNCAEQMLKISFSYLVWLLRYEHLNKNTIVKFERDVNTPRKENDVKIIIYKFKWRCENIKANEFILNTISMSFNISYVRISKKQNLMLLLRTLNSPLKTATLSFSKLHLISHKWLP